MTEPVNVTAPMKIPRKVSTRRMLTLDPGFVRDDGREPVQSRARRFVHAHHPYHLDMGVEADEHRREADKAVHRRHQLRHLGHLHPLRDDPADSPAARDQDDRQPPKAETRPVKRRRNGQSHADDPVPDRAFGAFLARQPAQRQDEQHCCNDVGRRGKSEFHDGPLTTSGTWRASGASP
jgi:hypothetical protein